MTEQTQFSFDPTEFAGKRALVTGGSKGMGFDRRGGRFPCAAVALSQHA
jgi:hypothetical protein